MTAYRVTKDSYLNDRLWHAGEIVEYDGPAGSNLERISGEEAKKLRKAQDDAAKPQPSTYELGSVAQRLDDLELTVGKDAIAAAVKKRDAEAASLRARAAAEKKTKDDADAKARATAAKAKADAEAKEDAKTEKVTPAAQPVAGMQ